jgi:hypothetical protein
MRSRRAAVGTNASAASDAQFVSASPAPTKTMINPL